MTDDKRTKTLIPLLRGAAWAVGLFCLVMAALLIATFVQTRIHPTIDNPVMLRLMESLDRDPGNPLLRDQIRALDLMARKAYFTSRWQLRWGGTLLIAATAALFALLTALGSLAKGLPGPPRSSLVSWWSQQTRSRKAIAGSGGR